MSVSAVVNVPDVLAEVAAAHGRDVHQDETWISVHDPAGGTPSQGWKIHVSARPGTLAETLARALPVLLDHGCDFKVARSPETLRELNSGDLDAGAVGKAITAYPAQDRVVALGHALADALAGMAAPRIVSDRRVRSDAPVYYRYAPFAPQYRVDENGDFELVVVGPDGERLPGAAGPEFSCPPWATDPFRPPSGVRSTEARRPGEVRDQPAEGTGGQARNVTGDRPARLIGNRYQVTSGVVRGPRGNVYRATTPDGRPVIVKEARAYVGENTEGWDLRMYLRNELRVLGALRGLAGVPAPLDHFRHGEDEFLVMTDAGSLDLNRYVGENGLFTDGGDARDLGALATRLLSVLDAVHECGVVVRDLSPKNVVLGDDGSCTLIDFGNSRYDGLQLPGWTRGYSVPDQHTGRDSEPADDYFSLGATLFFACAGMNPLMIDPDPAVNAERTLLILDRLFPGVTTGVVGLVPRLMSLDPATRAAAAADLRAGHLTSRPTDGRLPSRPAASQNADRSTGRPRSSASVRYTGELLSRVMQHTVRECARFAESLMEVPDDARRATPPVTNVYAGSAGLGMELLHHPESRDVALDLARWTARVMPSAVLPPGLYFGRTGTEVFLSTARLAAVPGLPQPVPLELSGDQRADQAHGVAGIGNGHLALAVLDQNPRHLAVAAECARRLLTGEITTSEDAVAPAQPGTGVAVDAAYAHGAAGCADFLLSYHEATGDGPVREAAAREIAALAVTAEALLGELAGPDARPMGASWCQGMAGIVTTLAHAAHVFGEDRHLDLAERGARACLALAPGAWVVSQCCGLAGIGESLVDLALMTGDAAYWRGAEEIAELMLLRAGGAFESPVFPGNDLDKAGYTWGTGAAGVLSFLRRLDHRTGPRLWTATPTPLV
ncbi:protein kinase/lanthionine synthetase C family protein [Nonomuraea sp. PA05]|uniref:class IV lanthionine synthetase LanL n=1 Tax=Nonomuraea sp. PA05 TaxID=2604466 RepID=UPI0011D8DEA0|nr:class IV lanthionine synthetase LanL [Nonomuraea sp. PA05]TYB69225.1 protein kinase/lanthionine synthetase C family protein [Nonomuraea sp. PA05]